MMPPPTVSIIAPHAMRSRAAHLTAVARHVEVTGLDGLFVGDHLTPATPALDSTLVLATAAAATTRIMLGFGVMVLALRHPAWAAKQVATLQQLVRRTRDPRVGIGGAVHGMAAWRAVGIRPRDRGARTDAALDVIRPSIAGEPVVLDGAELTLAPGAEPPPVWIGGGSAAARNRAVIHGNGWFPSMVTPEVLAGGTAHLAELSARHGRATVPELAVGASALLREPVSRAALDAHIAGLVDGYGIPPAFAAQLPLTGSPTQVAERLAAYVDAGAAHVVIGLIGEDWREQCALLAQAKSQL